MSSKGRQPGFKGNQMSSTRNDCHSGATATSTHFAPLRQDAVEHFQTALQQTLCEPEHEHSWSLDTKEVANLFVQ